MAVAAALFGSRSRVAMPGAADEHQVLSGASGPVKWLLVILAVALMSLPAWVLLL